MKTMPLTRPDGVCRSLAARLHEVIEAGLGVGTWIVGRRDHQQKIALRRYPGDRH
jgi:hypothetical protein